MALKTWYRRGFILAIALFIRGEKLQKTCTGQSTLAEARACCKRVGTSLPAPVNKKENADLFKELTVKGWNSTWLDIHRYTFTNWQWIGGETTESAELEGDGCAFFNLISGYILNTLCGRTMPGTICAIEDCRSCYQHGSLSRVCQRVNGVCLIFMCEDRDWFDASSLCRSLGATLAVIKNLDALKIFEERKYVCDLFWIGLRKEDWFYYESNKSIGATGASVWGGSYLESYHNCSTFFITELGYQWRRTTCQAKQQYVCIGEGTRVTLGFTMTINSTPPTSTADSVTGKNDDVILYSVTGGIVFLVIIVLLSCILVCRKRKICLRKNNETEEDSKHTSEEHRLMPSVKEEIPVEALQIVDCDQDTGVLTLDYGQLSAILSNPAFNDPACPLVVLSIAGPFQTGKSFLMNYLLRYLHAKEKNEEDAWMADSKAPLKGFKWAYGSTVTTYGIWIWTKPIRITLSDNSKVSILLMDTQGLYELDRESRHSSTMTALSCLLSTVQIYNVFKEVSEEDLERFNVFGGAAAILLKEDCKRDSAVKPVERLLFLVRDWDTDKHGMQSCGYEGGMNYMKRRMRSKNLREEQRKLRDELKDKVAKCECFLMPYPGQRAADGRPGYNGNLDGLAKDFKKNLNDLVKFLFDGGEVFRPESRSKPLSGNDLCRHIMLYIAAFNADRCAKPVSSVQDLYCETNKLAYQKAIKSYYESLYQAVKNEDIVIDCNSAMMKQMKSGVYALYDSSSVKDEKTRDSYRNNLKRNIERITSLKQSPREKYKVLEVITCYTEEMKSVKGKPFTEEELTTEHERSKKKACYNLDPALRKSVLDIIESIFSTS